MTRLSRLRRTVAGACAALLVVGALAAVQTAEASTSRAATTPARAAATTSTGVHVTGGKGAWSLTVDGAPYRVKGVTFDPAVNRPSTSLPEIRSMGANTVRDWGTDISTTTHDLLTAAEANGIRVIAGFWIDYGQDWTTNGAYQSKTLAQIAKTVDFYKGSDGVLMWDVGNEVMQNLPTGAQRVAYARFIQKAVTTIHGIDPDHPVTSTDSQTAYWPIYQRYAPSLDLFALNTYGGATAVKSQWAAGTYTKPYLLTEAGPVGWWEVPLDARGQPVQPSDSAAAAHYAATWKAVVGDPGVALGATMFHYSRETDQGALWFGVRPGNLKRASFYALASAWGGSVGSNRPPVISLIKLSKYTVKAGSSFILAVPATDPNRDALAYAITRTALSYAASGIPAAAHVSPLTPGRFTVKAPAAPGVYRYYARVTDGAGNVAYASVTVRVTR